MVPAAGARTLSAAMIRSVSSTSYRALSRFWLAMATSAAAAARSPCTFCSSSRTRASASDKTSTSFSASRRAHLVRLDIEPRPLRLLSRLGQLAPGGLDAPRQLGGGAVDLRFGLLQLRPFRLQRPLLHGGIEFDDHVAGGDSGAVGDERDDLEVGATRRRGQDDRAHRPDLAAKLQEIDEGSLGDDCGRQVRPRRAIAPERGHASRR
jgi:hypothetical protein